MQFHPASQRKAKTFLDPAFFQHFYGLRFCLVRDDKAGEICVHMSRFRIDEFASLLPGKFLAPAVNFLCQAGNGKYIDIFVTVCFPEHVFTKKEILLIIYVQIASKHQRMHLFFLTMDIVICAVVGSEPVDDLPARLFSRHI